MIGFLLVSRWSEKKMGSFGAGVIELLLLFGDGNRIHITFGWGVGRILLVLGGE